MARQKSNTLTNPINTPATAATTPQEADINARARLSARFSQNTSQTTTGNDLGSLGKLDVSTLLGKDPFAADCQIPEQSAIESNAQLLKIQRQENSLSVALAKVRLQQNVVQLGIENQKFQGLEFDYKSETVNTQTKAVGLQRSHTRLELETSKLSQDHEVLVHQQIATEGTQNLTVLVREDWQLRLENAGVKNNKLRIEIQTAQLENQHRLATCEAKLALVSGF